MSDYKRLTIRHPQSDYIGITETKQLPDNEQSRKVLTRLAELEDMIEQNVLIKLPCKVGDTVYWVFTLQFDEEYEVHSGKVRQITVDTLEVWVQAITRYGATFERPIDEIGKTFFLTKAEAEAKLEELKRRQKQ